MLKRYVVGIILCCPIGSRADDPKYVVAERGIEIPFPEGKKYEELRDLATKDFQTKLILEGVADLDAKVNQNWLASSLLDLSIRKSNQGKFVTVGDIRTVVPVFLLAHIFRDVGKREIRSVFAVEIPEAHEGKLGPRVNGTRIWQKGLIQSGGNDPKPWLEKLSEQFSRTLLHVSADAVMAFVSQELRQAENHDVQMIVVQGKAEDADLKIFSNVEFLISSCPKDASAHLPTLEVLSISKGAASLTFADDVYPSPDVTSRQ